MKTRRRGFSLIELLVVIMMMGGILTLTGTTFHLLMRSEKSATLSFVTERSIARLAEKFREDVHQSTSGKIAVNATTEKDELSLGDLDGVHIRYAITNEGLARLVTEGDEIVARDDFRLPECHVDLKADDDSGLRTLVIKRPGATLTRNAGAARPLRALQIQAFLKRLRPTAVDTSSTKPLDRPESQSDTTEEPK